MTDLQALERYAHSGDPDAFRHLVTCYQRMVYAACARLLREHQDIEDAVQETFLKLAQHAGRIKQGVASWLHTVATRTAIDRIRRDSTRRRHELAWRPEATDAHAADYGALVTEVDAVIAELPEAQREAVVGYFLQGRTQTQMAQEQGVTQSAMARRVERGVKELRHRLSARGVAASAGALAAFFTADAAHAQVPTAVSSALMKIGLGGGGGAGAAAGATATGSALSVPLKLAAALGVAAVVTTGVVVSTQRGAPSGAGTTAAAPAVNAATTEEPALMEAGPADGGAVGTDHGLVLVETVVPPTLTLMRRVTLAEEQIAFAAPQAFMALGQVIEQVDLEPIGQGFMLLEESPVKPDGDEEALRYRVMFGVAVEWEDVVPAGFTIEETEPFHGVSYELAGSVVDMATHWPKVVEQALFDGHELTGVFRVEIIAWGGPASDQNRFLMQLGTVSKEK